MSLSLSSITPLSSLTAVQVPPLQFQNFSGLPPRLDNTHLLTNLGAPAMPAEMSAMMKSLNGGGGIIPPVPNGIFSALNTSISSVMSTVGGMQSALTGQISSALSGALPGGFSIPNPMQALNDLQGMASSLGGAGIGAIQGQISALMGNLPTIGGIMTAASNLVSHLGLPAIPSFASVFAPFTNGGMASAIGGIVSSVSSMVSSAAGGLASFVPSISSLTSGFGSAIGAATSMLNGMTDGINSAVSTFMSLSNAATIYGLNALKTAGSSIMTAASNEFHSILSSVATPDLKLHISTPNVTLPTVATPTITLPANMTPTIPGINITTAGISV